MDIKFKVDKKLINISISYLILEIKSCPDNHVLICFSHIIATSAFRTSEAPPGVFVKKE